MTSMPGTVSIAVLGVGTLLLAVGFLAGGARAQYVPDSNIKFQSALIPKKPKAGLPDVKPQPMAWPRLDPGAVLCRSEDDLDRLAARRHGETVEGPVDCQVVRDPTAISIMQRNGPGRTEVKVTAAKAGDTGWTDAWLPAKAPSPGPTSASR